MDSASSTVTLSSICSGSTFSSPSAVDIRPTNESTTDWDAFNDTSPATVLISASRDSTRPDTSEIAPSTSSGAGVQSVARLPFSTFIFIISASLENPPSDNLNLTTISTLLCSDISSTVYIAPSYLSHSPSFFNAPIEVFYRLPLLLPPE